MTGNMEPKHGFDHSDDQSFRSFLRALEEQGELIRFAKPVDPVRNMAAVEWKTYNELGKSSLFTSIEGHPGWTACSQIVADRRKWAIGLGIEEDRLLDEIHARIGKPVRAVQVGAAQAPVKEIKLIGKDADLNDLPAMKVSERDGGRFIASGIAFVKDPDTGIGNMSLHRQQIMGRDKTGFVMLPRHARRIYDKYSARGEATPVAMVIGVHPAIWFSAGFTTGFGLDELDLAGGLLQRPVRTVKCETIDVDVPADAEIVLEGELVPHNHLEPEGPFGEVTGTYADPGEAHVFRLKAITRRRDPIYYALHCGFPATDTQSTTGLGIEVALAEHLRKVDGGLDLLDIRCLTVSGLMMVVLKMRPRVEGQARIALMAALSGPYQQPKVAVAVDDDIDASDLRQIIWSITTRVHAERDVIMIPGAKVFGLDNISPVVPGVEAFQRVGTKWMIDATKPAVTMPAQRARFDMALPPNYSSVDLRDFLP
ncbi:Phenolic acid decarboxylase subunit C [Pigmentiphaga humi]|uniref:Phenolic acid decarboxylase subunit C n=1 Tax=Pigmentiphaga humi TaxID=2478468 RepID=A0A3P4B097_9BURK|nr:UbiD family decarboxylase [Pigmentiphaga humi]VCU69714.1 Phenolic acid decarboxylase subunit C [Pigmentiphaga humi]